MPQSVEQMERAGAVAESSPRAIASGPRALGLFAVTIFLGAFLLFQVQPLIGKYILPWFGGTPAVWTTCMLFFQILLLGGYAYAHFSAAHLRPPQQAIVHIALLAAALIVLPIIPSDTWKPADTSHPTLRILALLAVSVGLPYFVLSATGPLLQAWYSRLNSGVAPYRLYALSNAGSLLALVSYPFVFEPALSRIAQAKTWSLALGAFVILCGACALLIRKPRTDVDPDVAPTSADGSGLTPTAGRVALWLALPACGSVLLLAFTNVMCQDVAVIPFLWVLPLSLYLLSFIISFDSPRWYRRDVFGPLLLLGGVVTWWVLSHRFDDAVTLWVKIALFAGALFVSCMVCHGELTRLKPPARHLTAFYLSIAAGGAVGGLFVTVVAPLLFIGYFELQVGLIGSYLLLMIVLYVDPASALHRGRRPWAWAVLAPGVMILGGTLFVQARFAMRNAVEVSRNFYGVLGVYDHDAPDPAFRYRVMRHGGVNHGVQYLAPEKRHIPAAFYSTASGIGVAFDALRGGAEQRPLRVGIIGLGAGALTAYSKPADVFRFYEINPEVTRLARAHFTFLTDAAATIEIIHGDGRLSLEREPPQQFDLLMLDAFTGDAIPVHLLTREAMEIYRRHLRAGGMIVAHITNHHLNLRPVVAALAEHSGMRVAFIAADQRDKNQVGFSTDWALLSDDARLLEAAAVSDPAPAGRLLWTDDNANLFGVMR